MFADRTMAESLNFTLSAPLEILEDYDEECPVPFAEHVNIRFGLVVVVGEKFDIRNMNSNIFKVRCCASCPFYKICSFLFLLSQM